MSALFLLGYSAQAWVEPHQAVAEIRNLSVESSPALKEARARYDGSRAHQYTAFSQWLPHVDFQLSDSWSRDFSTVTSGALGSFGTSLDPQDVNIKSWNLNANFPLYRRSVHLGFEKAANENSLTEMRWLSTLQEWDVRFADLLGQCLLKRFEIRVLERSIEAATQTLNEAKLRFSIGQNTKIELLRAEAHLSTLRNSRTEARSAEDDRKKRLVEYTGVGVLDYERLGLLEDERDEESVMLLIDALYSQKELKMLDSKLNELLQEKELLSDFSMTGSTPFRQFELEERVHFSDAGMFLATEWPELSLQGSYGRQSREWEQLFDPDQRSRSVSVVLRIPLFSGGSLISSAKERKYYRESSSLMIQQRKEKFLNDTSQDLDRARTLNDQLKSDVIEEQRFEEILRLTRRSYQLGKSTQREVLESERDWLDSRFKRARSIVEFGVVLKRLAYNLGVSK